jgi:hypothetical protein
MEKPEGKRPLGILSRGWVDNIKIDLGGKIDQDQDRDRWRALVNSV